MADRVLLRRQALFESGHDCPAGGGTGRIGEIAHRACVLLEQGACLFCRERNHHRIETPIGRAFAVQLPTVTVAQQLLDPRAELYVVPSSHSLDRRIHRRGADPRILARRVPARDHAFALPSRNLFDETRIARGEILRAVIEAQHGAVRFHAARGHASAGAAALVEQGDVVAESGQPRGAAEAGHAGADDRNLHRPVRLRHRP